MRCDGRGVLSIRTGIPGSTRGYVPGTIVEEGPGYNVRKGSYYDNTGDFEGPPEPLRCPVCLGTGWRSVRTPRPEYGSVSVHYGPAEGMPMEEILRRAGVIDDNAGEEPDND